MIEHLRMGTPPSAYGASARYAYSDKLARLFTAQSKYEDQDPFFLYRREGDSILLPRAVAPVGMYDQRQPGVDVKFNCKFTPRDQDQVDWVNKSAAFLCAGQSGISQAPTGRGKTAMAMPVIAAVGKKTMIVCTKEDLMLADDQWLGAFKQFLGLTDQDIGIVRQDRCDVAGKKVVIGLINSLAIPDRYPAGTFDDFGLIVWDEVHRVGADTFSNTAFLFPAMLRWGLSATPKRKDGKDIILHAHIGPVRVMGKATEIVPKVLRFKSAWECPRVMRKDPETGKQSVIKLPHSPGRVMHIIKMLANDQLRNDLIVKATKLGYDKKRNIVLFADTLEHLDTLRMGLKAAGVLWDDMGIYKGGLKAQGKKDALSKPLVITTYKMTSEGTNQPRWDFAVFATPHSDVVQIAGRILREFPGKPKPIIVDIDDMDSPVFAGYAASRGRWYRSIGAEIVDL